LAWKIYLRNVILKFNADTAQARRIG